MHHGTLNTRPVRILVDGGSERNFVHPDFVSRWKLRLFALAGSYQVQFPNGTLATCSRYARAYLEVFNYHEVVELGVLPISGYDVLLGKPWLAKHNLTINWRTNSLHLRHKGKQIFWQAPARPIMHLITASQFARLVCVDQQQPYVASLLLLNDQDADSSEDQCFEEYRKDLQVRYSHILAAPKAQLPPIRDVNCEIPTIPGAEPPIKRKKSSMLRSRSVTSGVPKSNLLDM